MVPGPLVSQPRLAPRKVPIAVFYGPAPLLSSHSLHTISNGFVSQTIESVYQSLSPWHNVHNTQQPQEAVVIVSSKVKDPTNTNLPQHNIFQLQFQCIRMFQSPQSLHERAGAVPAQISSKRPSPCRARCRGRGPRDHGSCRSSWLTVRLYYQQHYANIINV